MSEELEVLKEVARRLEKVAIPYLTRWGKDIGRRIPLSRGEQVKDTPAAIEGKFQNMLLKRSGAERLKMGCSMHATARAIAKAYISEQHPGAHPAELKRQLFLHFYGADFKPDARRRILSALSKKSRPREIVDAGKRSTRKPSNLIDLAIVKSSGVGAARESGAKYGGKAKTKAKRLRQSSR